jgi:hypothetical protein
MLLVAAGDGDGEAVAGLDAFGIVVEGRAGQNAFGLVADVEEDLVGGEETTVPCNCFAPAPCASGCARKSREQVVVLGL